MSLTFMIAVACASGASASGTVDLIVAQVIVENGHSEDCLEPSGLCLASGELNGVQTRIDAGQNLSFVGIALDAASIEEQVGVELLPDAAVWIDFGQISRKHPAFKILAEEVGAVRGPGEFGRQFSFEVAPEGIFYSYWGPTIVHPMDGVDHREGTLTTFGDDWIGYEQLGPFNSYFSLGTHELEWMTINIVCERFEDDTCESMVPIGDAFTGTTPDIDIGVGISEAALASSPDGLQGAGEFGTRDVAPDVVRRPPVLPIPVSAAHTTPLPGRTFGDPFARIVAPLDDPSVPERPSAERPQPIVDEAAPADLATAIGAFVAAFVLAIIFASLYSRISTRQQLLSSARRQRILQLLQEQGALRLSAMARALAVDRSTIEHHVRHLERMGEVQTRRSGHFVVVSLPMPTLAPYRGHQASRSKSSSSCCAKRAAPWSERLFIGLQARCRVGQGTTRSECSLLPKSSAADGSRHLSSGSTSRWRDPK